jgi:hypothetical protein
LEGVEFCAVIPGTDLRLGDALVKDQASRKRFGVAGIGFEVSEGGGDAMIGDFVVDEKYAVARREFRSGVVDEGELTGV